MNILLTLFGLISGDLIGWNRLENNVLANQHGIQTYARIRGSAADYLAQILIEHPEFMELVDLARSRRGRF